MQNFTAFKGTIKDLQDLEGNLLGLLITTRSQVHQFPETDRERRFWVESTVLVGHTNLEGGCCGCCSEFREDTEVTRYARVYDHEIVDVPQVEIPRAEWT